MELKFFLFGLIMGMYFMPILEAATGCICQCFELITAHAGAKVLSLNKKFQKEKDDEESDKHYGFIQTPYPDPIEIPDTDDQENEE